jgi:uncharacterized protein
MTDNPAQKSAQHPTQSQPFPMSYEGWRQWRLSSVTGVSGNLSMVAMPPLRQHNETFKGLAGQWSRLSTPDRIAVSATPADHLLLNGQLIDGTVILEPSAIITFSPTQTGRVAREVDGTFYLQVSDSAAPNLRAFRDIETYPVDAAWAVAAEYRLNPDVNRAFEVGRATESVMHSRNAPVNVHFNWGGSEHSLAAYTTFSKQMLIVTFTDQTTGSETPTSGRIMLVPRMPEGPFTFDFNQAMLPPHEFSSAYPCPLPPAMNRLPFAVTAGEKAVLFNR